MITTEFPTLTRVSIIDNDEGYFIKREKTAEILDIRFNTAMQAIDYARANRLIVIVEDDSGEIDQ
jgi:hypothetical protein